MNVEKNDVDISSLFTWGTAFELLDREGEFETMVYMRLVGDEDLNKSRVYALRHSAELRRKLRDTTSDEYLAFMPQMEDVDKDQLVNLVAMFSTREVSRRAVREVRLPVPKIPDDDATLERQEQYQLKIDSYEKELELAKLEYVTKALDKIKKELEKHDDESLFDKYVASIINEMCEQISLTTFREATTYYGTFSDNQFKNKFFSDIDQFLNLQTDIKVQFISAYQTLEIGGEELKKLQEATR